MLRSSVLSPTSLEANVLSHRAARRMQDIRVLDLDLRMVSYMARHPDFAERAGWLVDRDRRPDWRQEMDLAALRAVVAGAA